MAQRTLITDMPSISRVPKPHLSSGVPFAANVWCKMERSNGLATALVRPSALSQNSVAKVGKPLGRVVAISVKWPLADLPESRRTRKMARPPPTGPAQIMGGGAFRAARIPIRTRAVAATDTALQAPELAAGDRNLSIRSREMRSPGVNGELAHRYCLCLERQVSGSTGQEEASGASV